MLVMRVMEGSLLLVRSSLVCSNLYAINPDSTTRKGEIIIKNHDHIHIPTFNVQASSSSAQRSATLPRRSLALNPFTPILVRLLVRSNVQSARPCTPTHSILPPSFLPGEPTPLLPFPIPHSSPSPILVTWTTSQDPLVYVHSLKLP
jgi:hypothetical protein